MSKRKKKPSIYLYGIGAYLGIGALIAFRMSRQEDDLDAQARKTNALVAPRQGRLDMFLKRTFAWPLMFLGGAR